MNGNYNETLFFCFFEKLVVSEKDEVLGKLYQMLRNKRIKSFYYGYDEHEEKRTWLAKSLLRMLSEEEYVNALGIVQSVMNRRQFCK